MKWTNSKKLSFGKHISVFNFPDSYSYSTMYISEIIPSKAKVFYMPFDFNNICTQNIICQIFKHNPHNKRYSGLETDKPLWRLLVIISSETMSTKQPSSIISLLWRKESCVKIFVKHVIQNPDGQYGLMVNFIHITI